MVVVGRPRPGQEEVLVRGGVGDVDVGGRGEDGDGERRDRMSMG